MRLARTTLMLLTVALLCPLPATARTPPSQPHGLQVTAATHAAIVLTWDAPADDTITGYRLLRRHVDGATYGDGRGAAAFVAHVPDTGGPDTTVTDHSVTPHTRYVYRVVAFNDAGDSPRSSYANAKTLPAPTPPDLPPDPPELPARPQGVAAAAISHDAVTLVWNAPGDATITGYQVVRSKRTFLLVAPVVIELAGTPTTWTDEDVEPGTRYWYEVIARNAAGDSAPADHVDVTTLGAVVAPDLEREILAPSQPQGLVATAITHDAVALAWEDPGDATLTGYRILRRERDGAVYGDGRGAAKFVAHVPDTGSADPTWTDEAIVPGTRYVYRVVAFNDVGDSPRSRYLNVETPPHPGISPPLTPPGRPALSDANLFQYHVTDTANWLTFTWGTAAGEVDGYEVFRTSYVDGQSDSGAIAAISDPSVLSYDDHDVVEGGYYTYWVEAYNAAGETASEHRWIITDQAIAVQSEALIGPYFHYPRTSDDGQGVFLEWEVPYYRVHTNHEQAAEPVTSYQILRWDRDHGTVNTYEVLVEDTGDLETTYTDYDVRPGGRYVYQVRAWNDWGLGARSVGRACTCPK